MAKTNGNGGGADGWPGFLSDLTKNFLILRDIFGYALSGAVFFSIGVLCQRFSLGDVQRLLAPYHLPAWLAAVFGVGACYTVGHLMNQAAFLFDNTWKVPYSKNTWQFQWFRPLPFRTVPEAETTKIQKTEAALIKLRADHPALLIELERQSIMAQLRGSVGAAMLCGCLLFYVFPTPPIGAMVGVAGVFLLIVFWSSARPHIRELKAWTNEAGTAASGPGPSGHQAQAAIGAAECKQALETLIAAAQEAAHDPAKCKQALETLIAAAQEAAKKL
ncbi:MAG: hypothetical protein ABSG10_01290 [Terracidiphilus sp.]|jgi:hypothetical protein